MGTGQQSTMAALTPAPWARQEPQKGNADAVAFTPVPVSPGEPRSQAGAAV
jgi:hypothetical protein